MQGITEFLPVSSSAHLILVDPAMIGLGLAVPEQTASDKLILDVAVHVGSLGAVTVYFRRDLWRMAAGVAVLASGRVTEGGRIALLVVAATLPVVIMGGLFRDAFEAMRTVEVIAWTTLLFAVALYAADRIGVTARTLDALGTRHALWIGVAQVLALVPGVSRSGITMTAARLLGYRRDEAARFSMLLSVPTVLGAGLLAGLDVYQAGNLALGRDALLAALLAFFAAWLAIALMMAWLRRASFTPFVIYRLLLAALLFAWLYA